MITRGVLAHQKYFDPFHYHAKPAVQRPTLDTGDDSKDPRLAAIPEHVAGRALISCFAGENFGPGSIAVKRNRKNDNGGTFVVFTIGERYVLGV